MEEHDTLELAGVTDERSFSRFTDTYRGELLIHCYRMLGSIQDAEDLVQETFLRAWQNREKYDEMGAFRSWLYRIATNACLDVLKQNKRRALIQPDIPSSENPIPVPTPLDEAVWLEPFPDVLIPSQALGPEALYSVKESVNLAFMTVLHKLSPRHRAILILRDVLNWKAGEVADYLEITESAVNSALLRARKALDNADVTKYRNPAKPEVIESYLERYVDAWETKDISKLVQLLKQDAVLNMPPFPSWYRGRERVKAFLTTLPFADDAEWSWKLYSIGVNGQPGFAFYERCEHEETEKLFGIEVLTIAEDGIERIDHFLAGIPPHMEPTIKPPWLPYFNLPPLK